MMPGPIPRTTRPFSPFQPLPNDPHEGGEAAPKLEEVWQPQIPAPEPLPEAAALTWPGYGAGVQRWIYRNADGGPVFIVVRFEKTDTAGKVQKQTIPWSFGFRKWETRAGRIREGTQWHPKRPYPQGMPLYGLDRLATRPDAPVILTEGEKTADAAAVLFADHVAVCSQGGSNGCGNADWSALAGRSVIVWPDNDEPGAKYAKAAKKQLLQVGVADVTIVPIPEGWPVGWDVADPPPDGVDQDALVAMLAKFANVGAEARSSDDREAEIERLSEMSFADYQVVRKGAAQDLGVGVVSLDKMIRAVRANRVAEAAAEARQRPPPGAGETRWPLGFFMKSDGLYYDTGGEQPPIWVCPGFQVLGQVRDTAGTGWGLWLEWTDADDRPHQWVMPSRLLMVGPGELEGELVDRGLRVSTEPAARASLRQALSGVQSGGRVRTVDRSGWHVPPAGDAVFVMADGTIVGSTDENVVLQRVSDAARQMVSAAGTLDGWMAQVGALVEGNAVAAFAVCAGFAGPMLNLVGETSGGAHLVGRSKCGKTLAAMIAGTIWSTPRKGGVVRDWRSTSNGLELAAADSSDGLLVLDEIHQVEPREVTSAVYMLMNEAGKQRATKLVTSAAKKLWSLIVLSTGETDIASIAAKAGQTLPAGAHVRMPSFPVSADMMWPTLHGYADSQAMMRQMQTAIRQQHGTAGRAFLERLVAARNVELDDILLAFEQMRIRFDRFLHTEADAQVRDVARRCALFAFAGETAIGWGILPWKQGEAVRACKAMLAIWISSRGGSGSAEDSQHVRVVRQFLALHGASRFVHLKKEGNLWEEVSPERAVLNRAGWRRAEQDDAEDRSEYLILPDVWRQFCVESGVDPAETARTLRVKGYLDAGDGKNLTVSARVPGLGKARFYVIKPDLMASEQGVST